MGNQLTPAPKPLFPGANSALGGQLTGDMSQGISGVGGPAVQQLSDISSGKNFGTVFQQIATAMAPQFQRQQQSGTTALMEKFSSMGMASGSPAAMAISNFLGASNAENNNTITQTALGEQSQELGASQDLSQMYATMANAFYQPSYVPSGIGSLLGGVAGLATAFRPK